MLYCRSARICTLQDAGKEASRQKVRGQKKEHSRSVICCRLQGVLHQIRVCLTHQDTKTPRFSARKWQELFSSFRAAEASPSTPELALAALGVRARSGAEEGQQAPEGLVVSAGGAEESG